ncbi:MAG: hypothetical protein Fur0022_24700 [Anaerolineales bacterium]
MQSDLPKVLHKVHGRSMIDYSLEAAKTATGEKPVIVVGHKADLVINHVGEQAHFVFQDKQLGTGHAVRQAENLLKGHCQFVLVLSADMPLLTSQTLASLIDTQKKHTGPMSMVTIMSENARGFGRVIRNAQNLVQAVVEEAVATPEQLLIQELNAGVYCFSADWLWDALSQIQLSPNGEYYLTDLVEIAVQNRQSVQALTLSDPSEALGVNTQEHLREAELQMNKFFASQD